MKLKFGKKTLALLLMLTVALSLCTVSAWAEGEKSLTVTGENSVFVGKTEALSVTGAPEGATLAWASSNNAVATVSNGTVTGVAAGTATITVTCSATTGEGDSAVTDYYKGEHSITVKADTIKSATVSGGITVPYGYTDADLKAALKAVSIGVTYESGKADTITTETWTAVNGSSLGAAVGSSCTYTANLSNLSTGVNQPTVTVIVAEAQITAVAPISKIELPVGATAETVAAKVAAVKEVAVTIGGKSQKKLTVGTGADLSPWTGSYAVGTTAARHRYSTTLLNTNYELASGVSLSEILTVETKAFVKLSDLSLSAVIEGDGDSFSVGNIYNEIYSQIKSLTGASTLPAFTISYTDLDLGSISGSTYRINLTSSKEDALVKDGVLTDEITCTTTVNGTTYTCKATLTLLSENVTIDFGKASGTLAKAASALNERLKAYCGGSLAYVEIEDIDLDGGELFTDNTCTASVDIDETYTDSAFSQMYYVPDGSGETTVIEFTARTGSRSSSSKLSGYLYLTSDQYVRLSYQITTDDTQPFSAEEFESAFLDLDDDYESLEYITFTSGIPNSKTAGYLYYDGDTKVSTSKKYYVSSSKSSELAIDDLTFVPGTKGGVHSIQFSMRGEKDNGKSVTETGVIQITVVEKADVTITASKNASVTVDFDQFQDFFDANVSKSKKEYIITHIVFENAPHSSSAGYLYAGSKKLTSPDGKDFALDSDYKGDYDFDDLTYMGGSKDSSTRATFAIYGKKTANAKSTTKLVEGTVDFVTGNAGSTTKDLNASMKASQVMAFSNEINTLLGIQSDMQSLTFTSLPRTGKLVYNWGASGQTDVTVNTEYYLTASGTKPLLRNVTFVPGYTDNKSSNTVTFGYKAVNAKGKTVTGTFTITVSHAYVSERFYDVSNHLYADSVDFLYNEKITTGTSATTFNPNGQVTRMEFVTFLYRAAGSPSVTGLTNRFTDVSATTHSYYYNAILWATQNGITTGTSATTFNPTGLVTHSELLTFLYRYDVNYLRHSSSSGSLSAYSGWSSVASWAQTGAKWAAYKGILTDSTTPPAANGTRATVALWMHRMLTL